MANKKTRARENAGHFWQFFVDEFGKWRWRLIRSGLEIAASSVGYTNRTYCVRCAKLFGYMGS